MTQQALQKASVPMTITPHTTQITTACYVGAHCNEAMEFM